MSWRRIRVFAAWLAALLLCSGMIWAITWFRPQRPVGVVLVGAGYQENLAVPHNAFGWQGLSDLADICTDRPDATHNFVPAGGVQTIDSSFSWPAALRDVTDEELVLVVSAHAAADEQGPYLLPDDFAFSTDQRLRLDGLWEELASQPQRRNKLVIFDVTQIAGDWRLGFLNNSFARSLAAVDERIRSIPNLVVLCASGVDQQSWIDETRRRTVFMHYLADGLQGCADDADRDGRIDAAELHAWLDSRVADWVATHRGVEQHPLLLPAGEAGRERARRFDLTVARGPASAAMPGADDVELPPELADAWKRYGQFLRQTPAGFAYAPTQWREYVDTLLRYEQLLTAGDRENAERMRGRLAGIEYRMKREQVQAHASLQNSLSLYKVTQLGPLPKKEATDVLNELWNAKPGASPKIWRSALEAAGKEPCHRQMLRLAVFDALLQRAAEDPLANLPRAAAIAEVARSPLYPLPAEIHFLVMLDKYLPPDALAAPSADRLREVLALRRLAERAAVGHHDGDVYDAEQVLSWIAEDVRAADVQRRLGEDLLFAGANDRPNADRYFQKARRGYEVALENAQRVEAAIVTRDRVLARLPYYSEWLADATLDPYVANARQADTLRDAEELWEQTHALAESLEKPDTRSIVQASVSATIENPHSRSLVEQTAIVQAGFEELVAQYDKIVAAMAAGEAAPHWHAAQRALHVPPDDWRLRWRLLAKSREHLRRAARDAAHPREDASAATMTDAAEIASHRTAARGAAMTAAQWQGRMALATLGRRTFAQADDGDLESYDKVQHRLDVFEVEQAWWNSTMAAGEQIHARFQALPRQIDAAVSDAAGAGPTMRRNRLAAADRWARLIDGAQAMRLKSRPAVARRRVQLHDLALFLARRTFDDHWCDVDPAAEPYYRRAALAYLSDAERLLPNSPQVAQLRGQLDAAGPLRFTKLPPLDLTSQRQITLNYQLQPERGLQPPSGFAVSWLDSGMGLELAQPPAGQRIVRRFEDNQGKDDEQGGDVAIALESQPLQEAERKSFVPQDRIATELTLHGFFRGQVIDERVPVTLHLRPDVASCEYPLPQRAAVSLSTTAEIVDHLGTGEGAVALVLDCSGSMGTPQGVSDPTKSKYAEAVQALREVLARVPRGTRISLWTFGQYGASVGGSQSPEETIRRLQDPTAWNPADRDQLNALMAKIDPRRVRPWSESPIVRTILQAKDDVAHARGFKTILVITDGMDNCFDRDHAANPSGKPIPAALRTALADIGIALNIVAFKVADAEERNVQQQFAVVEEFSPPGKLYHVDQTEALAETLATALRHRLRFQLDSYDRDQPSTSVDVGQIGGGEFWPAAPLPAGAYQLRAATTPPLQTDVALRGGDVLALALEQRDGRYAARRRTYAETAQQHRPSADAGPWRATILQNQISPERELRLGLALENTVEDDSSFIAQRTPRIVWFAAMPHAGQPQGISWRRLLGFPAPVWNITAADWPATPGGQGLAQPKLRAWWSVEHDTPFSATLKRNAQRPGIAEMSGVVLRAADDTVRVESVAIENHFVEVSPGKREEKPCLVVRLKSTPGNIYWAQLQGLQTAGAEQRFYPSIGSYTGLFWPVTQAEVDRTLQGLGIVSLDVFQREAKRSGHYLELDNLSAPDANDILPTASYSFD